MRRTTAISWTSHTWNPATGCSKVSEGCRNCYAERLSLEKGWSMKPWTAANAGENVVLHPERLRQPFRWKEPCRIFVNSMSDLFHDQIPDAFLFEVFRVMAQLPQHTFQILTKRPERAAAWRMPAGLFSTETDRWPTHIWLGTSVEDQRSAHQRIPHLAHSFARVRFLSCEPLLAPIPELPLAGIDWVIVGGESGPGFRQMAHSWARQIRDQALAAGAAFFFKQSAAFRTETGTALLEEDGRAFKWEQYPGQLTPPSPTSPHRHDFPDAVPLGADRPTRSR